LRYGIGVFIGALITGIAYLGSSVIQWIGYGITDESTLALLWSIFVIWSVISFLMVTIPPLVFYFTRREQFRRFFFLEMGGVFLFTPLWLVLSLEITGTKSWVYLFTEGLGGIPFSGQHGSIEAMNISPILAIPILLGFLILGAVMLQPSFISKYETPTMRTKTFKVTAEPEPVTSEDMMETEMPEISRPVPDESSVEELRQQLLAIEVVGSIIERLISAGYATVTDLVAAKPEHISQAASISIKDAELLLLALQKSVWFGDI